MLGFFNKLFGGGEKIDLKTILQENAFLVDVRTPAEFASGHLKGSVNIPLDCISVQIAKFKNKGNIVVYCRSGNRSRMAKSILETNGIQNVYNGGGIDELRSLT